MISMVPYFLDRKSPMSVSAIFRESSNVSFSRIECWESDYGKSFGFQDVVSLFAKAQDIQFIFPDFGTDIFPRYGTVSF